MNKRTLTICITLVFQSVSAFADGTSFPSSFADAVLSRGERYRKAVTVVLNGTNAATLLERILKQEPVDSKSARHARILLAHVQHPELFSEFDNEIQKWRDNETSGSPRGGRPGFLSGLLMMSFLKRGPENRYIEVADGWKPLPISSNRQSTIIMRQRMHKKVEKYTDSEVSAGIARNAAARQAVLEHFLKFLDEGDAYEQSEMVLLVNRLWGHGRLLRTGDLAVVDHVQDVDALLESVFQDRSRPMSARMSAVSCLPDAAPPEVQAFMLDVVTNTPPEDRYFQSEALVGTALYYLESSADANALVVLENQTNGPVWKREKIEKASRAINGRLSAPLKDK